MIQRERYMQEIRDFMDKPVVKIITGMRRCGKSALLELTREELRRRGVQEQNIISMNFESLRYEAFKDYRALYQEVCKRADYAQGKVYILLDEIQEVDSWEQVINSLRVDKSVIAYLMDNIGNTFSAKTITDFLKNQGRKLSAETVYNYLRALESAFLIHKAVRFDIKGKRILKTQEKYYLSDLGLRHAVIGHRDNDIAGVLENIVYLELLRRGWTVYIGKQGVAEVDFVANRTDERLYIQVCYVLTPENTEREFGPLEGISDNYEKLVLSTDTLLRINRGGIRQKNIVDFLLET